MSPFFRTVIRARSVVNWGILFVWVSLAIWSTWPLGRDPLNQLPLGVESYPTVPLFNTWTMWWNADRLAHGFAGYWNAPIFHPASGTFAFSEPQPTTLIVAPLIWLTGSRVLAYNVYLWLSLVLNAVFTQRLFRLLGCARLVTVSAAAAMLLLPIVHWQRDVVQLTPLWGVLWTWSELLKITRRATVLRGIGLGAALATTCLTCLNQGLFMAVLLAGAVITLWGRWKRARLRRSLVAAAAVAALLAAPIVVPVHRILAQNEFTRSQESVAALSAEAGDYSGVFGWTWFDAGNVGARPGWPLSPGWLKLGLALFGAGFGLMRRRWRWWTAFLLLTGGLAFAVSLGANLKLGEWQPIWTLVEFVPEMARVRNVFRFAFFVQMAVVLLSFQALHWLGTFGRRSRGGSPRRRICGIVVPVLACAAALEVVPTAPRVTTAPDLDANAGWISFVRQHTPRDRAIACIPFAPGNQAADFAMTTRWMYFATVHEARLVNGYSGFFPQWDFELRELVNQSFPSEASLARLGALGVEFIVCQRTVGLQDPLAPGPFGRFHLDHVYHDPIGVDVYRLRKGGP